MTAITLKRKLRNRIDEIEDVDLLKSVYDFLNSDFIGDKADLTKPGIPMTPAFFRERILAASKRAKNGKVISQDEVEKISSKW